MERGNFSSNLIVQSGGGHWPFNAYNIRLASNWPVCDWLGVDMGADGRSWAQIKALNKVVVMVWEYQIFLQYS